ncbi:MAG: hypothetical protein J2P19_35035, partial [Pseudonocardia sp.]|nr:hypothetical protein [Pseudonocardia sp.]
MSARPEAPGRPAAPGWLRRMKPDRRLGFYPLGAAVVVFVVGELVQPGFASASGVKTVLVVASFVGLVAAGQPLVV